MGDRDDLDLEMDEEPVNSKPSTKTRKIDTATPR